MAGDLTQELHRIVHGFDFYRVVARLATGQPMARDLLTGHGSYPCALIRFDRPRKGKVKTLRNIGAQLAGAMDSFGLLQSSDVFQGGGDTNDDRSAYALVAGNRFSEVDKKAKSFLANVVASVDRP